MFTERLSWLAPYQRKTARLERVIEKIAFSTNCLTAEKVCESLHIRISHDILLRRVKKFLSIIRPLPFVGIDDFAFKKRTSYGTILIDLKTKQPIYLLDSRGQEKVMEWLKAHPNIKLITRDGSRTYAKAITQVSEDILQVGDRWHILHQLFEAVKKTITGVNPLKWKPSQKEQWPSKDAFYDVIVRKSDVVPLQNEEKRLARIQEVQSLYKQGYSVTAIHKKVQISRSTV